MEKGKSHTAMSQILRKNLPKPDERKEAKVNPKGKDVQFVNP